jgi:hypothetical protein
MNQSMKLFYCLFLILFVLSCSTDDGGTEMDNTNTTPEPTPQETFGNWSPDFTNQTSDFTQTRTGSQGTQQTRTINVTSSSNTTTSTEESINQDINDDGDLFEDIEVILTTYTGSENLGSHQITTYNVTEDNDMGMTIGNNFYSFSEGYVFDYGEYDEYDYQNCDPIYNFDLYLFSEGIQYGDDPSNTSGDNELYGSGDYIYFELWMDQNSFKLGDYNDLLNNYNQRYNQSFTLIDDFDDWYCDNYDCDSQDDDFYQIPCNELILGSSYNSYDINVSTNNGDYIEAGENGFNFTEGNLSVNKDSNNIYTIKLTNGVNENLLPIKLYYRGYIGYHNTDSSKNSYKKPKK